MSSASDPSRAASPRPGAAGALLVFLFLSGGTGTPAAAPPPKAPDASAPSKIPVAIPSTTPANARDPARSGYPVGPVPGPVASAGAAKPANPHAGDPVAISQGRRLFVRFNCYGCHGGRGGGGMGPSLRDSTWLYGSDDADIFDSIAQGRGQGMPAWRTRMNPDDIWKLVAYIKSFGSDQEPEPPR